MSGSGELLPLLPSAPGTDKEVDSGTKIAVGLGMVGGFLIVFCVTAAIVTVCSLVRCRRACLDFFFGPTRSSVRQRIQNRRPMPGPPRAPNLPPQPAPPRPPAQPIQAWQPPIALVPLHGDSESSSAEEDQLPQQIADARDGEQPPINGDSPDDEHQSTDAPAEQKPLLAADDERKPLRVPDDEHQPLEPDSDSDQQPLLAAAGLPLDQQSDKKKNSTPSSQSVRRHKSGLPFFSTQHKPRTTQRVKTLTELGADEERCILLDSSEEQPLSDHDQPIPSTDDDGRHMRRQYGTSSLHSACETGPVSKSITCSSNGKEEDTTV